MKQTTLVAALLVTTTILGAYPYGLSAAGLQGPPRAVEVGGISLHLATATSTTTVTTALQRGEEWAWFLPGNRILAAPEEGAEVIATLPALAYLPILTRDGQWTEVSYQGRRGWSDTLWEPPHDRGSARQGIVRHRAEPVRGNDPWKLRAAREILGVRSSEGKVGAYTLFTDVEDEDLLAFLDSAAVAAQKGYFARYGRLPTGNPVRSVVLFATEESYRRFAETQRTPNPGTNLGHAGSGVLAFYVEGRSRRHLASTLVHEIAHLLNARSLARQLPTWLEEGIATDLGGIWIEPFPKPEFDANVSDLLSVGIQIFERRLIALEAPVRAGQLPHVMYLVNLDRDTFYQPGIQTGAYSHSAALVRYLLDNEEGPVPAGFRGFLRRIADGRPGARLLELIGQDADEFDNGFRDWIPEEATAMRGRVTDAYPGVSIDVGPDGRLRLQRPTAVRRSQ